MKFKVKSEFHKYKGQNHIQELSFTVADGSKPIKLLVISDSVGLGILSNTQVPMKFDFRVLKLMTKFRVLDLLKPHKYPENQNTWDIGFMNSLNWLWNFEYSAYLSSADWSIPSTLNRILHRPLQLQLRARMGASFDNRAKIDIDNLPPDLAIIFVQLGAMDFLLNYPVAEYKIRVAEFIENLIKQAPNAYIIISHIPDLVSLYLRVDKGENVFSNIPWSPSIETLNRTMYGQSFLSSNPTFLEISAHRDRLEAFQNSLDDLVHHYNQIQNSQKIIAADVFASEQSANNGLLAMDGLHPSLEAQRIIADNILNIIKDRDYFELQAPENTSSLKLSS